MFCKDGVIDALMLCGSASEGRDYVTKPKPNATLKKGIDVVLIVKLEDKLCSTVK